MLEEYSDLVTSFGEKKTVLDLKDSAEVKETIAFKDVKTKDIKDISLEDFVDIGLAELFSGEAVDAKSKVKFKPEQAAESAKARMQKANISTELNILLLEKSPRTMSIFIRGFLSISL